VSAARILFFVASIGAFALIARTLLVDPIPLWMAGVAFVGYVALITCGTMFLGLQMFLDVTLRGPKKGRKVALTFDDGPSPEHTPKVLDLLDEAGVKATFFVIGRKAEKHPELVKEIAQRGHALGVHGYVHDRLFCFRSLSFVRNDLKKSIETLERLTGERPVVFRPPVGLSSSRIAKVVKELKLHVVGWSVRALDGVARSAPENIERRVVKGLGPGEIVLMHDAAERDDHDPPGVTALPHILAAMKERKLSGVRVDEWI